MIVFILRHADRQPDPVDDLKAAGVERAKLLARMLAESGVNVALRSEFIRSAKTLQPLEAQLPGLEVEVIPLGDDSADAYATAVVAAIRTRPANAVVVTVGHSDTVGPTIERLGAGPIAEIKSHEFDKLFVVFVDSNGAATLLKLRYGKPT